MTNRAAPSIPQVHDLWVRVNELLPEGHRNIEDQHVVSKVLLKKFAVPSSQGWQLSRANVRYPNAKPLTRSVRACGKVRNFVAFASESVERMTVENRLPAALAKVQDLTIFDHPNHVETIKDAVALHFARSIPTAIMHERSWQQARANQQRAWLGEGRGLLTAEFVKRFGLYPAGNELLVNFLDELMEPLLALHDKGALFRARVEELFERARAITQNAALEVLVPARGEFLIGDSPVLTLKKDHFGVGILGGVPFGDADAVVLPLGSDRLVALATDDMIAEISEESVKKFNSFQILTAAQHVFFRPHSGLENLVAAVLKDESLGLT